ncbi:MAG: hypothetical protein HC925_04100 [Coleofasciculaceae cyanobacterium SM2_3_26]|nr:hypothetical protein [Coleofasciculaceae cyanobacterium SM2_3_26]
MWFPRELLSPGKFWLNQGISGDTTRGVLQRLSALAATRPNEIYVMAGINDIRLGRSDGEILSNLRAIARELKQQHPQARIYLQSILPTRYAAIAPSRLRYLNQNIAAIARQEGAIFVDLSPQFASAGGVLTRELTTDGLHLSHLGYRVWQAEMQRARYLDPRGLPFLSQGY